VSEANLDFYREHGYVVIRDAVPSDLLVRAQALIEPWVDASVASWREAGVISEGFERLDRITS
jgi:hypothetical protein